MCDFEHAGFLRSAHLMHERVADFGAYPFSIPAVRGLAMDFHPAVTFLVGENGGGKSTVIEALAVAAGFNAEGGTANFDFATRRSESEDTEHYKLTRDFLNHRERYLAELLGEGE